MNLVSTVWMVALGLFMEEGLKRANGIPFSATTGTSIVRTCANVAHCLAYRVNNMFSTLQSTSHSARKRMISNIYSKSYIHSSPHAQAQRKTILYDRLFPIVNHAANSAAPVDIFDFWNGATMD